jgi:DNA-binding PadR family transcriptional regulator
MITELDVRLIRDFLDVFIFKSLKKHSHATGYSLVRYFHQKFHLFVSSGTVCSKLYLLERQCLLDGVFDGRRRVFTLTRKGEEYLEMVGITEQRNQAPFLSIFSPAPG